MPLPLLLYVYARVQERQMQLASETKAEGMEFVDGNGTPYRELSAMMADLVLIKVGRHFSSTRNI
jgi:hypothetical protein